MADSEKEKVGIRTKAGDYNRAIDQSIALKQELAEIEKSLKKYELLEKLGDTTSKISEKSELVNKKIRDSNFADPPTLDGKSAHGGGVSFSQQAEFRE